LSGWNLELPGDLLEALAEQVAARVLEATSPPPEDYWTTERAAEYLAVAPERIRELVRAGAVAGYRDGRNLRVKRSELDRYMEGR